MGQKRALAPSNRDVRFTAQKQTFVWYYGCQILRANRYPEDGLINGRWSLKNQLTEKASDCGRVFTVSIPDVPDSDQNRVSTFKICRRKPCIVY
jgi:hypothetical protein